MATQRVAVVTGSNKGLGFGICKLLVSKGVLVVLTARDEQKGTEALEKLKSVGLSDSVIFHHLDVADSDSVSALADFIKTKYGRLDILVNNAGVAGAIANADSFRAWPEIGTILQSYDLAVECLQTNYFGAKRMTEAFVPLLQLSDSPRIVNVSSSAGKLKNIGNEWAKGVLGNTNSLTEERVEEVLNEFLKDFKEDSLQAKGWPSAFSAYTVSKAAVSAYTRIIAKKYPNIKINCVCPGYVKTDGNHHTGILTIEEGAEGPVMLALLPDNGPSGLFFFQKEISSFE